MDTSMLIIACPGGQHFAEQMRPHLQRIYARKYRSLVKRIRQRYSMSEQEVQAQIHLIQEIESSKPIHDKGIHTYHPPKFMVPVSYTRFANGEVKAELEASVRDQDVFIVQDVENHYPQKFGSEIVENPSVNDNLMVLFTTIEAVMQAGANRVSLVLPAYPYSRQHKKKGREALTASWFGRVCEYMGVSKIITLDIHSREIENAFNTLRLENLHASYQIVKKLMQLVDLKGGDVVVVSPDTGAISRNRYFAGNLGCPLAMLYKERDYSRASINAEDTNIVSMKLLGDVKDKIVFMADDILGTGGTMIRAMELLKSMGAKEIICAVSLPLFNSNAVERFRQAHKDGLFSYIIGTNAVHHKNTLRGETWFVRANITELFAQSLYRMHAGLPLGPILDNSTIIQNLLKE
jgi:ribose-phosphate pyrophosphokinase